MTSRASFVNESKYSMPPLSASRRMPGTRAASSAASIPPPTTNTSSTSSESARIARPRHSGAGPGDETSDCCSGDANVFLVPTARLDYMLTHVMSLRRIVLVLLCLLLAARVVGCDDGD